MRAGGTGAKGEIKKALRRTLFKYQLHSDTDLFDRAYGYIKQSYEVQFDSKLWVCTAALILSSGKSSLNLHGPLTLTCPCAPFGCFGGLCSLVSRVGIPHEP